jgi:hypothetical protein
VTTRRRNTPTQKKPPKFHIFFVKIFLFNFGEGAWWTPPITQTHAQARTAAKTLLLLLRRALYNSLHSPLPVPANNHHTRRSLPLRPLLSFSLLQSIWRHLSPHPPPPSPPPPRPWMEATAASTAAPGTAPSCTTSPRRWAASWAGGLYE